MWVSQLRRCTLRLGAQRTEDFGQVGTWRRYRSRWTGESSISMSMMGRTKGKNIFHTIEDHGTRNRLQMGNAGSEICILLMLARDPIVILRSYRREQRKINSIPVQQSSPIPRMMIPNTGARLNASLRR